jgi:hypothetical protein
MAHSQSRRTFPLATPAPRSRAHSIISDASFNTPRATPPSTRRGATGATRGLRANSIASEAASQLPDTPEKTQKTTREVQLPPHYFLAPTVPSPFTGTLNASLDAILEWNTLHGGPKGVQGLVTALQQPVDYTTDWPYLIEQAVSNNEHDLARNIIEELLFLLTRTLLPEQIVENRSIVGRLYDKKKHLAIRLILRYDMLREWKMEQGTHHRDRAIAVASVSPSGLPAPPPVPVLNAEAFPHRRPLLPNIIHTLIAAPPGGHTSQPVRERMKHHVTDLDTCLLLPDELVAQWGDKTLKCMTSQIAVLWQWLRQNNAMLDDMETYGWEELDGKADENEWIAEDIKRSGAGAKSGDKKEAKAMSEEAI